MRVPHYIKCNDNSESPSNILLVDTETKMVEIEGSQYQTFRLGYAIHLMKKDNDWVENGYELYSISDLWHLITRFAYSKKKLYVVAHNMAFDYTILKLDTFLSFSNLEIRMRVIDQAFLIRAGNIVFISSTNFYRQSLKELGEIFGLSKMDSPDFSNVSDSELMKYCKRDVEVLSHIMKIHIQFIKDKDLGSFKPTIAGQAFTAFRHRFMNEKILVHNHESILKLESESYRGGRCEAFRIGKFEKIFNLDINSMYPFVMKENQYPIQIISNKPLTNLTVDDLDTDKFFVADCDITLNKPFLAVKREKLFFPIGNVRQVITSPEINYIIKNPDAGKIVKIHSAVPYNQAKIFKSYVDFFYNKVRKNAKNKAEDSIAKLFLNSIYGKFGQRNSSEPELITDKNQIEMFRFMMKQCNTFEICTGTNEKYVLLGKSIYKISKKEGEFAKESVPIIASAVTSYARTYLYEIMNIAGLENVFYCDTDSVFVNESGYNRLYSKISPTILGFLKLERFGNVEIFGAKDYRFNDSVKLKGIKKDAKKLTENSYSQSQFITKNLRYLKGIPDGIVKVNTITKTIKRDYDKGIVKGDTVFPLNFSDF